MNEAIEQANRDIKTAERFERFEEIAKKRIHLKPEEKLLNELEAANLWSYVPNMVSVLTAVYAVYFVSKDFSGIAIAAVVFLGFGLLIGLEAVKRALITKIAQRAIGFALPLCAAFAISMGVSYFGGANYVTEESTEVSREVNPEISEIEKSISEIEKDIQGWKAQTWKGTIYRKAQEQIGKLEDRRTALFERKMKLIEADDLAFDESKHDQQFRLSNLGFGSGAVAVMMDLLLFVLVFRTEKKEQEIVRLYGERQKRKAPHIPISASTADVDMIQNLTSTIEELKKENEALRARVSAPAPMPAPAPAPARPRTHTRPPAPAPARTHARGQKQEKECKNCKKNYSGPRKKFCSDDCSREYQNKNK